ncbi:DUF1285 domain-containing protein [Radicibacter daui]|uniref:DUF1285 domain-containing protein n=1 Tax=Radicibacter daui TaxID=3064829 RepID=UPI004046CE0D
MRIARDGTWYHEGTPIGRMALVKLFATVLRRDEQGDYWLQTPVERGRIEVEDVPFIAVEMAVEAAGTGAQTLRFRTNIDAWVTLDEAHPLRVAEDEKGQPAPYILVEDGIEARLSRSVFYDLVALAETAGTDNTVAEGEAAGGPAGPVLQVMSAGRYFRLGAIE